MGFTVLFEGYINGAAVRLVSLLDYDMDRFTNEPTNLDDGADDLIWMLQSSQVSQRLLIEELVCRYYQKIYFLAYTILEDKRASSEAAQRTLANAVVSSRSLREDVDLNIWLDKLAWENIVLVLNKERFWRKLEKILSISGEFTDHAFSIPISTDNGVVWDIFENKLSTSSRRLLVLHCIHGWSANKISQIIGVDASDVQMDLNQSWQIINKHMNASGSSDHEPSRSFERALLLRWERDDILVINQERIVEHICSVSGYGKPGPNLSTHIKDALVILIALITIAVLLWSVLLS